MKKKTALIFALTLALGAGASYYYYPQISANLPFKANPVDTTTYQTANLSRGNIESVVNATGTLNPVMTVSVGSELSGTIVELKADFNSQVKKGEVIARLDDRTIRSKLLQNEADVASTQAALAQQQTTIASNQATLNLNKVEYERLIPLVQRGMISRSELDKAKAAYDVSIAQLKQAQAQVTAAKAQINQKQAILQQTKLDLNRTEIRSPLDGMVIDRQVDIGQTVAASLSSPTLFKIAQDLSQMKIEADVDEADIGKIKEGQIVRFSVDAYPERKFNGAVEQVRKSSTVNNNVVTYKVIIKADNADKALLPGMTANVDLITGQKENVLRVPNAALRFKPAAGEAPSNNPSEGMAKRMKETFAKLNLTPAQQKQVDTVVAEFRADMEKARAAAAMGPGPNMREQMGSMRQKMSNALKGILNEKQFAQYQEMTAQMGGGGAGGRRPEGMEAFSRGEIWLLVNGKPTAKRVRVGLTNDEFSEIQGEGLDETTVVITRANRKAAP
jgi:HlyD family secretion protein